jgi:lipoprotein-anchoring transpeptidase ErfK/SrfK
MRPRFANPSGMATRAAALAAVACAAGLVAATEARPAGLRSVDVWFVRDGALVSVERRAGSISRAVDLLLAGPTARERRRGLRSAVPKGTRVHAVTVRQRVVVVDLASRFAAGTEASGLRARIGQLVKTVAGIPGVRGVRVLVEGGVPVGLFPGYDLRRPLGLGAVKTDERPGLREVQELLRDLGFLGAGGVTGTLDDRTAVAVLGFQKWAQLPRTGVLDAPTSRALLRATRPLPATLAAGRRVEVLLDRQLALLVDGGRVLRAVHISTGAYNRTPAGSFRVFRKERMSWSVPFSVWMPWASYFVGGIAFHEYPIVPAYPASHGCIRVNRYDAPMLYEFATSGTPVQVLWSA